MNERTFLLVVLVVSLAFPRVSLAEDFIHNTASLSQAREGLAATTVGDLILFGGGTDVVDIYDTAAGTWSTATLSVGRAYPAATAWEDLAFFAGGYENVGGLYSDDNLSDVVDIYDASTGAWSTATLSQPRAHLTAVTAGDYVLFAGGRLGNSEQSDPGSDVVDIFNAATGTWSATTVPGGAFLDTGTSLGETAIFGGDGFYCTYAPATDTWNHRDEASLDLQGACSVGGGAVFVSGDQKVYRYDAATEAMALIADDAPRYCYRVATIGHSVFFADAEEMYGCLDAKSVIGSGDLDLVRAFWGQHVNGGRNAGDWTEDGVVNSADLDIVRAYWEMSPDDPPLVDPSRFVLDLETGAWSYAPSSSAITFLAMATHGKTLFVAGGGDGCRVYDEVDVYTVADGHVDAVPEPGAAAMLVLAGLVLTMRRFGR